MKRLITAGATDQTVYVFIQDSASTTGAGKTGLAYNTASLVCYYVRDLAAAAALTLATQTVTGAHSDGGFVEVDATNTPGLYRLDLSDAVIAAGVSNVVVMLKGATDMAPVVLEIQLAGGQIATVTNIVTANATQLAGQTITAAAGVTFPTSVASPTNITAATGIDITKILGTAISTPATAGILDVNVANILNATANGGPTAGTLDVRLDDISLAGLTALSSAVIGAIATDGITAGSVKADAVTKIQAGLATPTNITAGTLTTVTNLTNLPAAAALEATLTAMKGATFSGATDSLEAIRDRGDAAWATAAGFSTLDAAGVRTAVGLASANLDTQLAAIDDYLDTEVAAIKAKTDNLPAAPAAVGDIPSAAAVASQVRTELTTELGRIDVATSTRLATAGYTAPLDAAGTRTAIGMASANLDTQLGAIDDLIDTEIGAIKAKTDYLPSATAGAAGGLFIAGANAATSVDTAFTANIAGSMSGNVEGNVNGSAGSVVGNVGGNVVGSVGSVVGFTASNIADIISTLGNPSESTMSGDIAAARAALADIKGATFDTATDSLEAIRDRGDAAWDTATGFSTLDAAGVRAAVGLASANLDTQLTAIDDAVDTEVAAIYTRLGAPAGASIAADIAGISAGSGLDAAGVRAAIGLATANLDTQLAAIDDLVDTEVAAIKAKTDYLPSATAGAAGGLFIAGANAATTVNITGDITGNLSGSVGSVAANGITDTSIATDAINAAAVKADAVTKIQNGLATPTNITAAAGIALSAGERTTLANAILDVADGATTNYTLREALEVMLAVLAGKLSGAATATITIRDVNDTKNVVVATTDASGNRTAVTVTP